MGCVIVTRQLPEGSLDPVERAGHQVIGPRPNDRPFTTLELRDAVRVADAIICVLTDRIDRSILEAGAGNLRVVANVAVGYDNIDVRSAHELGVLVCNTPGVLDDATADLAFLLILASARQSGTAEAELRQGRWRGWNVNEHLGQQVSGQTLGIVGWGRIAQRVARRAQGFDMRVLHHSRTASRAPGFIADLDEMLGVSDIVTVHVPLTDETRHLIDARRLQLMKPSAVLVNTSRGAVVDENALAAALRAGRLFAAGLDVYEGEPAINPNLLRAPRTVLLPHIGSATIQTRTAMARLAAHATVDVLDGRIPTNVVTV